MIGLSKEILLFLSLSSALSLSLAGTAIMSVSGSGQTVISSGGSGSVTMDIAVASSGGTPFTLGNNTVYATETLNNPDEVYSDASGVSVGTTGTYDTCYYWSYCTVAGNAKILVYDDSSPQSLICTSDAISIGTGGGWISEVLSDNSCGTYTANDVVHLAIVTDCYHYLKSNGTGNWDYGQDTSGTYTSPPSTVPNFAAGGGSIEPTEPHSAYCSMVTP